VTRAAGSVRILRDIEGFVPDERNGLIAAYELLVLPGHAGLSSEVQCPHLVAVMEIVETQYGHAFVVGAGGGAASCLLSWLTARMSRKTANATITKLMTALTNTP